MNIYYLISFVGYFAFFIGLSIFFYKKNSSSSSFILGDRSFNYWVTALSTQASDMSDWLFMGFPGLIYAFGFFNFWIALGLVGFMFLNWHFVAPKLRIATEHHKSITLASFFERRFNDSSGILRMLTVFFTLYFIIFYIGAGLIGLGRLFETTFGINYTLGIAISIILVVLNLLIGGFAALAWGDMFRGLFLLIMILIVPLVALRSLSGGADLLSSLQPSTIVQALIPDYSFATLKSILLLSMGWGLGYFGSPHILMNFMSIKNVDNMHKAKYVGLSWQMLVLAAAACVGLVGRSFFTTPLANRELVFIEMVKILFNPLFAGLVLCAVLAATMSVMTAQVFATASLLSEDFFKRLIGKPLNDAQSLLLVRGCIVVLPLLAYAITAHNTCNVNDLVSYAWSGLGLSFAPTVLASLYLPCATRWGAGIAILLGGFIGMIWSYLPYNFMPLLPGFALCMAVLITVSWLTHKRTS